MHGIFIKFSIVTLIAWKCKSLTTYNFCFNRVRYLNSFQVDKKSKSIDENVQTIESVKNYGYGWIISYNNFFYLHALISKSLTTYNFCFNRVRDLISFQVDQKLKLNWKCTNDKIGQELRLWLHNMIW